MNSISVKRLHRIHRWTGLVSAANLIFLALTGFILVFHEEVDALLGVAPKAQEITSNTPASYAAMLERAKAQRPNEVPRYLSLDPNDPSVVFLGLSAPEHVTSEEATPSVFDAGTGEFLQTLPPNGGVTGTVLRLHTDLLLGAPGRVYIILVCIAFFVSLITGAIIYGPFAKRLGFGALRPTKSSAAQTGGFWSRRRFNSDVHRLLGPTTLAWNTVVATTGLVTQLTFWLLPHYQRTELQELSRTDGSQAPPASSVSIDSVVATAAAAWPNTHFAFLAFPGSDFAGPRSYTVLVTGTRSVDKRLFRVATVDAESGALIKAAHMPWYLRAILIAEPLHFGDYGGMPLKILWGLFSIITIVIAATGVYVLLSRRYSSYVDDQGSPEDKLRDAAAVAPGTPVAASVIASSVRS